MTFTYTWGSEEKTSLKREDELGNYSIVPTDPANTDYQAFIKWCEEGNEPLPYAAPEPPAPPTPEEKLAASGLTVDELKSLLGL